MTPYYERNGITIYCGECSQVMRDVLADDSIDLTVTSPPYDDLRDYNGYVFDFGAIAGQLWRVTMPGGVVVWVVADATVNGSETGTSFRQALGFMELGFNLHDTMIYERYGPPSVDIMLSRYYQSFEFMLVFSKKNVSTCNYIRELKRWTDNRKQKQGHRLANGDFTIRKNYETGDKIKGNIWRFSVGGGHTSRDTINHPAQFPEALARDHIISWSNPGDLVLDPMVGSGTTLKMAQALGRRAIGIEISEDYCRIAVDRLRQPSFFSLPDEPKRAQPVQLRIDQQ